MPLIFALPLIVGGYALFTGAIANKTDPSPAPVTGAGALNIPPVIIYGTAAFGAYMIYKKVKK